MRRALIAAAALLLLGGCVTPALPPAPGVIADTTIRDEQAALAVELAYQAAALAVVTANRAGLIPVARRDAVAAADRAAYAAVLRARAAYDAGNATSWRDAEREARALIADLITLIR